jgi:membrane-associated protein
MSVIGQGRSGDGNFLRKEILFFKPKYLHAAERYFHKNGSRAITIGRFVPAVRTFIPIVAGVVGMPRKTFMFYNAAGGIFWVFSITLLGFFLGQIDWVAEMVERQLTLVAIAIIIVSVLIGWFENRHSGVDNEDVTT